ncbi:MULTISPECIES: hypothetical protein [Bacteria]|jgi:hypothetical protein|uniref:Uncharacterized protein n=4 Tax=Sphingomonas TaxID=13687 RepID=A0A0D1JY23_9SPHN|nr:MULTISPECIES: hypothetical protein [Bacteria]KIU26093.1 hypothetical protein SR41_16555 [Sphingomonas melonis]MBB3877166.1 hypothetical protein [Sphingomonas aquatilis]MBB4049232.1 hypothetical protein [Sphingomonas zeae]MBB4610473.1 hypothetical protein [Sphingomonas yabuuchiae]NUU48133.1 hypothetical protein [Sphingomonas zeae]
MTDRVSASITIGGVLDRSTLPELESIVRHEGLSTDWDGAPFHLAELVDGKSLTLKAHEVARGAFEALEAFCVRETLPFVRWSGACPGQWGAERLVFTGSGEPTRFPCDEDDYVVIGEDHLQRLATFEAALAYFEGANFVVPPIRLR